MQRMLFVLALSLSACGGKQSSPPTPTPTPAPTPTSGEPSGSSLTAQQCQEAGGEVVVDIGDGAIHRPDYRCAKSGNPPLGPIAASPGQPQAIEGAVCCK